MPSSLDSPSSDKTNLIMNNNSSPLETTLENPDQVMDMFLHQVTEYNAQQLSFDDRMANANDFSSSHFFSSNVDHNGIKVESTSQDLSHFSMPTSFLGGLEDQSISTQAQVSSSSSAVSIQQEQQKTTEDNNTTKRHSKQKSKEGSSLLHVFTNPLLHAIPMLARNCLNFEDFLTQAAIQGQNGLLGSKDGNKTNNGYTTPDSLILDPTSDKSLMMTKPECPWHVKVLGLPLTGAKSRVETQIKICLQLTNSAGELATNWSHLILPEHMVARDKLKRRNQKYTNTGELHASDEKSTLADSDLLKLEAAVVCDSHADNEIIMCSSCVHRERKRMKRKRDNKVARAANKEGGAAKLAALFANDLPDLTNENVMAEERKKILLFNCSEYVEFNNGEATLPTRVTCYCRHHSEKVGFRIVFTIKDCHNHVLGTGRSPPIMITDDHKSSKAQSATPAPQSVPATSQPTTSRKRSRNDDGMTDMKPPALSKRKGACIVEGESDSGISSPVTSTPATPISNPEETPSSPAIQCHNGSASRSPSLVDHPATQSSSNQYGHQQDIKEKYTNSYSSTQLQSTSHSTISPSTFADHLQQGGLYEFLNSNNLNMNQLLPMAGDQHRHIQQTLSTSHNDQPLQQQQQQQQQQMMSMMQQQQEQILSHLSQNPLQSVSNRRRPASLSHQQQQQQHYHRQSTYTQAENSIGNNVYTKILQQRKTTENSNKNSVPRLHRLIPSEGPIYGGSEVTVLGSNFYEGLTCLFGENPAIPTHCWSANTLLCILPPAVSAGPVVVSFKEHPLMLEGQDVVLFTYFDESDRALMELALQVVGLKTMGKVEDARQIAMRIVQGDSNNQDRKNNNSRNTATSSTPTTKSLVNTRRLSYRHYLTTKAAQATYDNARMLFYTRLEDQIIAALLAISAMEAEGNGSHRQLWIKDCISITNRNRHTLLHLAAIRGYARLVHILVHLDCPVDQMDRNGFTALHFASWTGKVAIVKALLDKADSRIETVSGKTALQLATDAGHENVVALFNNMKNNNNNNNNNSQVSSSLLSVPSRRRSSSISSISSMSSSSGSFTSVAVRVPLIDIIPSSAAVSSAKSILPDKLFNMLSSLYTISSNTSCIQQLSQSVTTVYTSMLDPF